MYVDLSVYSSGKKTTFSISTEPNKHITINHYRMMCSDSSIQWKGLVWPQTKHWRWAVGDAVVGTNQQTFMFTTLSSSVDYYDGILKTIYSHLNML